jgi:D-alanine-D-alanine ligase
MLGIPYVGSNPSGHALALDKVITKIIMQKHDIPTPKFWVFSSAEEDMSTVEFPVIVKPKMESVSFGLKVVHNVKDLQEAVAFIIQEFDQQALVEQFVRGREFAVGIIGNNPLEAFSVLEIDLENNPDAIQTDMDKRQKPRNKICPANISEELAYEMIDLSKKAFRALQLRDFARVDIRLDENNNIHLLEINSMASLGANGSYVFAASKAGYDYKALVNKMLDVAAVRYFTDYSWSIEEGAGKSPKMPLHVRMRGFLRGRQENIENLLRGMVNTNSYVRNVEGVNELGNMMKKQLSGLGFAHQVIPQLEVGNLLFFTNTVSEDYDILLIGNLDNTKKLSQHQYFQATELKLSGTGIWEHKGGLAVMIHALQALKYTRLLKKIKIGILLTTDDSLQGKFAYPVVREKSMQAKYILGMHGAFLNGGIVTSRSGAAYYRCQMNLMKTDNATDVAKATGIFSRLVHQWTELTKEDTGLIVAPHDIRLESNIREPFAHGEVTLSVRFHEQSQFDEVDRKIKQLVPRKFKNLLHFQLEGGLRRVPMLRTEKVEDLYTRIKTLSEKLDIRLREEHRWSSADICFVNNEKHVIDGMGPAGAKPTRASEYILRHSLLERSALLAMTLYELGKK